MSKTRSKALQKEINRLAAEIRLEHAKLEEAGKRDLLFIHKHLKKAAKGMKKAIKKAKPRQNSPAKPKPTGESPEAK